MLKAIIFDLGGVVFTNGTKVFINFISKSYNLSPDFVKNVLDGNTGSKYRESKITREEFWSQILKQLNISGDINKFEKQWIDSYKLIDKTRDLILLLRKKYKIYYLSDNIRERVIKLDEKYMFLNWFDDGIFSHEVGIRKPDPKIYNLLLKKINTTPDEVLFIDDKESSLIPAKSIGMTTLLFESPEKLEEQLLNLKVLK